MNAKETRFDCERARQMIAAVLSIGTRSNWASGCSHAQFVRNANTLHLCASNGVWRVSAALGAFQGADELLVAFKRAELYELLSGLSDEGAFSARVMQDGARRRFILTDATGETLYDGTVPRDPYEPPLSALSVVGRPTEQAWIALVACLRAYKSSVQFTNIRQVRLIGSKSGLWLYFPIHGAMRRPYKCRLGAWTDQPFAALINTLRLPLEVLDNPDTARQVRFAAGDRDDRQAFAFLLGEHLCLWQDKAFATLKETHIEQMLSAALPAPNVGLMTALDVAGRFVFANGEAERLLEQIKLLPLPGNTATAIELKFVGDTCVACAHSSRGEHSLGTFKGKSSYHFDVERLIVTRSVLHHALRRVKLMRRHEPVCAIASCRQGFIPVLEINGSFHLPI